MTNNYHIFNIILKDYRQYLNRNDIQLESTAEMNINVIEGQNGAGKSNILNAITFCFYGQETHIDSKGSDALETDPYVTKQKLNQLDPGESAKGFIEVRLGKDEPEYAFRRTFTTVYQGDDSGGDPKYSNSHGKLTLKQRFGGDDWAPIPQPENVLSEILPPHVHQYFLFDGEQLDEFFDRGYSSRVKKAVLDVSHIELLNGGISHLEEVRKRFEKESSNLGGDTEEKQRGVEVAENILVNLEEEQETLESDIETAQKKVENINNELSGSADDEVREKQNRREFLEGKLDEKEDQLVQTKQEAGKSLAQAGALAYNADALVYTISAIDEYESDKRDLPGLTEDLLDAIISRQECVCGEKIDDIEDAHSHFEELLEQVNSNGEVRYSRRRMERAIDDGSSMLDKLIDDRHSTEEIAMWIDEKESELIDISKVLEDKDTIDNQKATELERQRQRITGRISEMNRELGTLDQKIERQKEKIEDKRKQLNKALKKQDKNQEFVNKSIFVNQAVDSLSEIKQNILEQVRTETERRLEQYYNDLIWKDEDYKITLTENYEVELFNQHGRKNIGSLSAGEGQVLALSFMAALSKISGFSAPIVIDTPLGRISSDPKRLIAQNLPNYLDDTQVTLLMTDEEYNEAVRAYVANHVSNEYNLEFIKGATEVKQL